MLTMGSINPVMWKDNWTVVTEDGSLSAQFEHTLLITPDGAEIMTQCWQMQTFNIFAYLARRNLLLRCYWFNYFQFQIKVLAGNYPSYKKQYAKWVTMLYCFCIVFIYSFTVSFSSIFTTLIFHCSEERIMARQKRYRIVNR